ncbi:MAG: hypothetical protein FWF76_03160 [Oscillospiraceae bacterium]|nr:hypothetical protein [Oscillospiraceae bacterium]
MDITILNELGRNIRIFLERMRIELVTLSGHLPDLPTWLWIVIATVGGFTLLIIILLFASIKAQVEYHGDFSARVKYLGICVYDSNKSKKKSAKKAKRDAKRERRKVKKARRKVRKAQRKLAKLKSNQPEQLRQGAEKGSKERQSSTFAQKVSKQSGFSKIVDDVSKANSRSFDFEMFKLIYDSSKKPVKRLISKMKISRLEFDCMVAGDDAFKVALSYGAQSVAISGGLAWLDSILKLKVKRVNVVANFEKTETEIHMKFIAKLKVKTVVFCLIRYIVNTAIKTVNHRRK